MVAPERGEIAPALTKPIIFANISDLLSVVATMDSKFLLPREDAITYMQMNPHAWCPHPDLLINRVHWEPARSHAGLSATLTHYRGNREINPPSPKLNSFPFPAQDKNPACSVLLSLTTPVLSLLLMLPLLVLFKCYTFGEDHSHLKQYGSLWCI